MIIIGDIAGEFDALVALADKHLGKKKVVLVGELVDRGPKSREVVQYCLDNAAYIDCIYGNHEDMFVDWYLQSTDDYRAGYDYGVWHGNGGIQTLSSYGGEITTVPVKHIEFLKALPKRRDYGDVIVTHAPINPYIPSSEIDIWHRGEPPEIAGRVQVFGHNSFWGYKIFGHVIAPYAVCIDTSGIGKLTAIEISEGGDLLQMEQFNFRENRDKLKQEGEV